MLTQSNAFRNQSESNPSLHELGKELKSQYGPECFQVLFPSSASLRRIWFLLDSEK